MKRADDFDFVVGEADPDLAERVAEEGEFVEDVDEAVMLGFAVAGEAAGFGLFGEVFEVGNHEWLRGPGGPFGGDCRMGERRKSG